MKCTFDITGMTCSACQARVEQAAASVSGVESAVLRLRQSHGIGGCCNRKSGLRCFSAFGARRCGRFGCRLFRYGRKQTKCSGARSGAGENAPYCELLLHCSALLFEHGTYVWLASACLFSGRPELDGVCAHAILVASARYLRQFQVFPRWLQNACAQSAHHGYAYRAWFGCFHAVRHCSALSYGGGAGCGRYHGCAPRIDGFVF